MAPRDPSIFFVAAIESHTDDELLVRWMDTIANSRKSYRRLVSAWRPYVQRRQRISKNSWRIIWNSTWEPRSEITKNPTLADMVEAYNDEVTRVEREREFRSFRIFFDTKYGLPDALISFAYLLVSTTFSLDPAMYRPGGLVHDLFNCCLVYLLEDMHSRHDRHPHPSYMLDEDSNSMYYNYLSDDRVKSLDVFIRGIASTISGCVFGDLADYYEENLDMSAITLRSNGLVKCLAVLKNMEFGDKYNTYFYRYNKLAIQWWKAYADMNIEFVNGHFCPSPADLKDNIDYLSDRVMPLPDRNLIICSDSDNDSDATTVVYDEADVQIVASSLAADNDGTDDDVTIISSTY